MSTMRAPLDLPELSRCSLQAQRGIVAAYEAARAAMRGGSSEGHIREHAVTSAAHAMFGPGKDKGLPQKIETYIDGLIAGMRLKQSGAPGNFEP